MRTWKMLSALALVLSASAVLGLSVTRGSAHGGALGESCPPPSGDGTVSPFVIAPIPPAQNMTTQPTKTASDGSVVHVYAGAAGDDPLAGLIVTWTLPADPCVAGDPAGVRQYFCDPTHTGALRLTTMKGSVISFIGASNQPGSLDVTTGVFV